MTGVRTRRKTLGRLGERLMSNGVIAEDQLRQALERQRQSGGFLGELLVGMGFATAAQIKPYLEEITGFPFVDISEEEVDPDAYMAFPENLIVNKLALPFREQNGRLFVAMADPLNLDTIDELRAVCNKPVSPFLALTADLTDVIKRTFDVRYKTKTLLEEITPTAAVEEDPLSILLDQAEQAPIVRLVNSVIGGAVSADASDIHVEPQESNVRVRYRIDGVMFEQMTIPTAHHSACISRLKVMSGLDIGERRRPQDGRFTTRDERGNEYDVRVSVMPTVYGEKACMRLLEKSHALARIEKLGFLAQQRILFEKFIRKPHGLILVTGPTGSGKSTTLYAGLQSINDQTKNINTIEDPVEYHIAGVNQVQVNNRIGVTFANGLRTLVRQDPDIILVGEIRDGETAEMAVQAALTGHLVLSTLHTNDAPGALVRLQNMGVERFLISSAVVGVMAQRLVRTLCPHCREIYTPHLDEALALGIPANEGSIPALARAGKCRRCGMRGTRGRTAAIEIMEMTDTLRDMVLQGRSGAELAAQVRTEGMMTMRESAIKKALDQEVAPDEIMRVFAEED